MFKILWEVVFKFATEHFSGIVKALTIHREFAVIEVRDVFGAALRIVAIASFFVGLPTLVDIVVFSLLALSLLLRVTEATITLWMLHEPVSVVDTAVQSQEAELDSTATA